MNPEMAQMLCGFPEHIHPVSKMFLDYYLSGLMATQDFLRYFSLPNSDYIPLARCFVNLFLHGAPAV
jgi:hypothetical protein